MQKWLLPALLPFALLLALPARANNPKVQLAVEAYDDWGRNTHPPGVYRAVIETRTFENFVLGYWREEQLAFLTYEEWLAVVDQLQRVHGYRLLSPPFSTDRFYKLMEAKLEWLQSGGATDGPLYTAALQSILEGKRAAAQAIVVPRAEVRVPPSGLTSFRFPAGTGLPTPEQWPTAATLALNETGDEARGPQMLAKTLEVLSASDVGRRLLADLVPKLLSGKLRFAIMTREDREKFAASGLADANQIGALFGYEGEGDELLGVIRYDPTSELGILVERVGHEAVHATDPVLAADELADRRRSRRIEELEAKGDAASKTSAQLLKAEGERLAGPALFRHEKTAFDFGNDLRRAMVALATPVRDYYDAHVQKENALIPDANERYIWAHYPQTRPAEGSPCAILLGTPSYTLPSPVQ